MNVCILCFIVVFTLPKMTSKHSVMILQYKSEIFTTLTESQVLKYNGLYSKAKTDGIEFPVYEWMDCVRFERELENIVSYLKGIKNKIKCDIIAVTKDEVGDSNVFEYGNRHYKVAGKISKEECKIDVKVSKQKGEHHATLTLDDKIRLFREYWEEKHKLPEIKDVYKEFKIGLFYATCIKNKSANDLIEEIISS